VSTVAVVFVFVLSFVSLAAGFLFPSSVVSVLLISASFFLVLFAVPVVGVWFLLGVVGGDG
jgi:hypothetical protein